EIRGRRMKEAPLPRQRGVWFSLAAYALFIPRTVAMLVFDSSGQAHLVEQRQERLGRQLLDVDHALGVPFAAGDQQCGGYRRYAGGVGDALAVGLGVGFLVVGDVIDEQLARLAVLGALDQVTNAGL